MKLKKLVQFCFIFYSFNVFGQTKSVSVLKTNANEIKKTPLELMTFIKTNDFNWSDFKVNGINYYLYQEYSCNEKIDDIEIKMHPIHEPDRSGNQGNFAGPLVGIFVHIVPKKGKEFNFVIPSPTSDQIVFDEFESVIIHLEPKTIARIFSMERKCWQDWE